MAAFDGGSIVPDAGVMLLGARDRATGLGPLIEEPNIWLWIPSQRLISFS
jgi:hypothetical protein